MSGLDERDAGGGVDDQIAQCSCVNQRGLYKLQGVRNSCGGMEFSSTGHDGKK